MPLHVTWDNDEKTIIRCESEGRWTWDEYHAALDQIAEMMRSVNNRAVKVLPANLGINVVVVRSTLGRAMSLLLSKMPNNKMDSIKMVGNVEDAYAAIAQDRAKSQHS